MILTRRSSVGNRILLFVASMAFHDNSSASGQFKVTIPPDLRELPGTCYQCVAFEGINNPTCEFPVARKANTEQCRTKPSDTLRAVCGKLVVYSKGHKEGQTLKSWLMKRECVKESTIRTKYDNLVLPCNTCGQVKSTVRIFQRRSAYEKGSVIKTILPDEQEQIIVLMCVCCEPLCNAEEGFNLSSFNDVQNSDSPSSRNTTKAS